MKRRLIWIFSLALSLSLIAGVLLIFFGSTLGPLAGVSRMLRAPFERAAAAVERNVEHLYAQAADYERLRLENEELAAQKALAQEAEREASLLREENERLRALLHFSSGAPTLRFSPARVRAESGDNWGRRLTLTEGSEAGLALRDCVVDGQGRLIGQISSLSAASCELLLLSDPGFSLGAQLAKSGQRGQIKGDFSLMQKGLLRLEELPLDCALAPGDEVCSASTEGRYPEGLLIGRVLSVDKSADGLFQTAIVQPAVALQGLRQVFVITDFQQPS